MGNKSFWHFSADGTAYSSFFFETAGDFFQTDFGSQVCNLAITRIGRGVTCVSRNASILSDMATYKKS